MKLEKDGERKEEKGVGGLSRWLGCKGQSQAEEDSNEGEDKNRRSDRQTGRHQM